MCWIHFFPSMPTFNFSKVCIYTLTYTIFCTHPTTDFGFRKLIFLVHFFCLHSLRSYLLMQHAFTAWRIRMNVFWCLWCERNKALLTMPVCFLRVPQQMLQLERTPEKEKKIIVVHNILSQQSLFSTACINFCMVKKWGLWPICKNLNPLWKLAAFVHIWTAMKITLFWALSSPVLFSINITCFLYLQQVVWTLLYDSYTYLSETFVTMVTRRTQTVNKTWASRFTVRLWIWTCFCNIHIPLLG